MSTRKRNVVERERIIGSTSISGRVGNAEIRRKDASTGRTRKVVRSGGRNFTGFLPCGKAGGTAHYESINERNLFWFMEHLEHGVESFREQPETFRWREPAGRRRTYTPDVLVVLSDGSRIYREVKPAKRLERDPDLKGRLSDIRRECARRNASYEIWTDVRIAAAIQAGTVLT